MKNSAHAGNTDMAPVVKTKRLHLEAVRIFAAFFVIFNHTGEDGFFLFAQKEPGSIAFWLYLALSIFCKVSVPLFFTISGALMLGREDEPLGKLWGMRIGKIALVLLLVAVVHHWVDAVWYGGEMSLRQLLLCLYNGSFYRVEVGYGFVWYLYAYIAFLICLPFLRAMVKGLRTSYFYYLIAITLVLNSVLPAVQYLLGGEYSLYNWIKPNWLTGKIVFYPCLGYFLEHRLDIDKQKRVIPWLWLVNLMGIGVSALLTWHKAQATGVLNQEQSQGFHELFTVVNCLTVYLTLKYLFTHIRIPKIIEKGILSLGGCTFGIYLTHVLALNTKPAAWILNGVMAMGANSMFACFVQCGAVMLFCYGVTLVLKKIPFVKNLL